MRTMNCILLFNSLVPRPVITITRVSMITEPEFRLTNRLSPIIQPNTTTASS